MESKKRYGIDRRSENDNRRAYDLNYFLDGGIERRRNRERRRPIERRVGWVKADDWKSVYLGNLICVDDFRSHEDSDLAPRSTIAQSLKDIDNRRRHSRFWIQDFAYAVLRPSSRRAGEIVDISMGGLSFRYPDTGEEHVASYELDIIIVGENFHLDKVPFRTVSERDVDIESPDHSLTMKQCGVRFDELTSKQIAGLGALIEKYTTKGTKRR